MSDFDLAIGLDEAALALISDAVHAKLYPAIFTGSLDITIGARPITLSWKVTRPPRFTLSPPPGGEGMVGAHLDQHAALLSARLTRRARGMPPLALTVLRASVTEALQDSVFSMAFPGFELTIGDTPPVTQSVQVTVYVQARSTGGTLSLLPLKVEAVAADPGDQGLVDGFIAPRILDMARALLTAMSLPPLSAGSVALTPPNVFVGDGRIVAVASIAGRPVPDRPSGIGWPAAGFFALFSDELRLALARDAIAGLGSQAFEKSGSVGTSIGGASYHARANLADLQCALGDGPRALRVVASLRGNCRADVTLACVPIGVNYDLTMAPSPVGASIEISARVGSVAGSCRDVQSFTVILVPSGNVAETVLSAITWPITQAVAATLSPLIQQALTAISFSVPVPSFTYRIAGATLTFKPTGLSLSATSGMLAASGSLTVA